MQNTYIKLYRELKQWEWYRDSKMVHLFIHLLLSANFKLNKWQGIEIERGQILTGLNSLNNQTGISVQSLRTCLNRLKSTGEITIKSTNKYSLITLINWEHYQDITIEPTNKLTSKLTNDQQATNNQLTTPNKDNKDKKDNNEDLKPDSKKPGKSFEDKYKYFIQLFNEVAFKTSGVKRSFRSDTKSKRQFKALLKEGYTSEDFKKAIKNLYINFFHRDKGFIHATPELITRSDKFSKYLNAGLENDLLDMDK